MGNLPSNDGFFTKLASFIYRNMWKRDRRSEDMKSSIDTLIKILNNEIKENEELMNADRLNSDYISGINFGIKYSIKMINKILR